MGELKTAIVFFFMILSSGISAQKPHTGIDEVYGSDPLLYNGKYYTFHVPVNTIGHQYLTDKEFQTGSVRLRGVDYNDLKLNYDIYNQQLLLRYPSATGAVNLLIISDAWLEAFTIDDRHFEIITSPDSTKKIFQVLGNGPFRILYHWKKNLELDLSYGAKDHVFTGSKEMNLYKDDKILAYRNNRSFYSLFNNEQKHVVKEYARRHRINVKKAGDQLMTGLVDYYNSMYQK